MDRKEIHVEVVGERHAATVATRPVDRIFATFPFLLYINIYSI